MNLHTKYVYQIWKLILTLSVEHLKKMLLHLVRLLVCLLPSMNVSFPPVPAQVPDGGRGAGDR